MKNATDLARWINSFIEGGVYCIYDAEDNRLVVCDADDDDEIWTFTLDELEI